jgi:hypothetical protein
LKKQSQFAGVLMNVTSFSTKYYDDFAALRLRKKKAKQSQMPAFGAKFEALSANSQTRAFDRVRFEKTKPIHGRPNERNLFSHRGLWENGPLSGPKSKANSNRKKVNF